MAFIFTNMPADAIGRRPALEAYLNQLDTADQEQLATDAGISFTPATDIDVATQEDYLFLAVDADASTYVDYSAVAADVRDRFEEASIDAMEPEAKWAVVQPTSLADKTGPVFTVTSEAVYLELMISNYPDWSKFVYDGGITAGIRDTEFEDFAMQLSGDAKSFIARSIPTASYGGDVVTGLFTIADDAEYEGVKQQVYQIIKKKK